VSTTRSSDELPAVVIDTDIGDNVDDSLALALAARWPQIRLLGVTTVFGDTRARAEMAKRTLICAGRPDIGVYMDERFGSGEPPRPGPPLLYDPQWVDSLRGDELDLPGVSFLRTACRKATARRPLLVCCLGPLTNLAKLLWLWPHLTKRIRITAMAGAFGVEGPDTNVRLDPEAADMVLSSGAQVTLIPLDVTHRLKLAPQFFESWSRCRSPLAQLLAQQVYRWLELTQRPAVVA
jgi:purine nucleosidase